MKITIYEDCKPVLKASSLPELRKKLGAKEMTQTERNRVESTFIQAALNAVVQKHGITDITHVDDGVMKEKLFIEIELVTSAITNWLHQMIGEVLVNNVWYSIPRYKDGKRFSAYAE